MIKVMHESLAFHALHMRNVISFSKILPFAGAITAFKKCMKEDMVF